MVELEHDPRFPDGDSICITCTKCGRHFIISMYNYLDDPDHWSYQMAIRQMCHSCNEEAEYNYITTLIIMILEKLDDDGKEMFANFIGSIISRS